MQTHDTTLTIEKDCFEYEVQIRVGFSVDGADPDVGIMSEQINIEEVTLLSPLCLAVPELSERQESRIIDEIDLSADDDFDPEPYEYEPIYDDYNGRFI